MSQNLYLGGLRGPDGEHMDRWPHLAKIIANQSPHLLLLQETLDWEQLAHRQILRAEQDLGMRIAGWLPAAHYSQVAMYYDPEVLTLWRWEDRYSHPNRIEHGLGVGIFTPTRLPKVSLAASSVHLDANSGHAAAEEIKRVIHRVLRPGHHAVIGGDFNTLPARGPLPLYEREGTLERVNRWQGSPQSPAPNLEVDQVLGRAGFTDAAAHLAQHHPNIVLEPTVVDQVRLDRFYVTPALLPALTDYRVIRHQASDHHAIVLDLDLTHLGTL